MPQVSYLQPADLDAYGAAGATPAVVAQASTMVDAYLRRPEGLLWSPDAAGQPCWMTKLDPDLALPASAAITPGSSVAVALPGFMPGLDDIGDVLVLDRATQAATEACTIIASAPGAVTLAQVRYAHAAGCTLERGLLITEERTLPARRSVTQVTRAPIGRLVSGVGRYGYGRRSQQGLGTWEDMNLLSDLNALGGVAQWFLIDVANAGISRTGDVWLPAGVFLGSYTDVRLRYVAGWTYASLPPAIKQATANLVATLGSATPSTTLRRYKIGPQDSERFSDSQMDSDVKAMLAPYRVAAFL